MHPKLLATDWKNAEYPGPRLASKQAQMQYRLRSRASLCKNEEVLFLPCEIATLANTAGCRGSVDRGAGSLSF